MTPLKEILAEMRNASEQDVALVKKAYEFAEKAHEGHKRYSGEPYFVHPSAVAKMLATIGMDAQTIAAGLLHDSIEDAKTTAESVQKEFGDEVLFLVEGVTKLGKHKYHGEERHAESLRRLLVATSSDVRVLIIKLADRFHNMKTLEHVPEAKRRRIALETLDIYAPLADRLGMGHVKKEIEDLSFPYVDPDAYAHTLELRKHARKENEEGLVKVQKTLQKELAKKGFKDFSTEIRVKGLWSLHQKLKRKGDDITKINDIAALRVIVPTVDDCYTVLGIIHTHWTPLPGEFKDYIAFPKPNGYQSLHTTVFTPDAGIVEMQIRTSDMQVRARFGVASHLSYKQLGKEAPKEVSQRLSFGWISDLLPSLLNFSKKPVAPSVEGKESKQAEAPKWLAEIANAHTSIASSKEFLSGLKEDFFNHRVFVFTPRGDVIDLPIDSTPVDFAYAIHSTLGDHLQGAKVNGKMVSFDTVLKNGDRVEIIDRESTHPTAKWLNFAKTSLARRHIRLALGLDKERTKTSTSAPRSKPRKK